MKVRHLMRSPAVTIFADDTCLRAAQVMAETRVGALPVLAANGRLTGIITNRDIVVRCVAEGRDAAAIKVGDLCRSDPITISAHSDIEYAVHRMLLTGVRRLPVVEQENVVIGMISIDDIATEPEQYVDVLARVVASYASHPDPGEPRGWI